jgi:threonine/homoserine/homoserine lactone efflux protein
MENLTSSFEVKPNLPWGERVVYVIGELGLTAASAQPRPNPLLNVLALGGGSYLAYSGYKGHGSAKAALFDASQPDVSVWDGSFGSHGRIAEPRS